MLLTVPSSGCSLDEINCVCHNTHLIRTLGSCMLANCTVADSQTTSRVQASLCGLPHEDKRTQVYLATAVVYPLACLFVALRLAGKIATKRLGWDDGIVVAALLLAAVPMGFVLAMTKLGFGEHLWDLGEGRLVVILKYCKLPQLPSSVRR
jgi:hypothetical protein